MKLYLVYISNYGESILDGCSATNIVGVYKTREEAERKREEEIKENEEIGFLLDEDIKDDYLNKVLVTMFWSYQENWNNYFEIYIEEIEVE